MLTSWLAIAIIALLTCSAGASHTDRRDLAEVFRRPLMTRIWQYQQYTLLTDSSGSADDAGDEAGDRPGQRVDIAAVAAAIAGMKPTYVCSLVRLRYGMNLTGEMVLCPSPLVKVYPEDTINIYLRSATSTPSGVRYSKSHPVPSSTLNSTSIQARGTTAMVRNSIQMPTH